ncbi:sigma factor-like helix-turn-helix DNA-binding protein [Oscillibacter sp.]|uniref:sigma factor-like helix-turn-helix DNA-binding protein n=1 Tax=Oscillibacter sp. TaxID=1945593 RepID=UPI0028ABCD92|nr:sigma factor-like helix-turn-helix DNA-binding protein [Oscillibacter sp.]
MEFLITRFQRSIEDMRIEQEQFLKLHIALDALTVEERLLIYELFFNGKSERILASKTGISNMTIHDRKCRILKKLKN